jgi:hypothetical protein
VNPDDLDRLVITVLQPFTTACMDVKEEMVANVGARTALLPTFAAMRTEGATTLLGSCSVLEHRATGVEPGWTRWMHLCRQVVLLTGADTALVAIEMATEDPQVELLEISVVTPEVVTTTLRPYCYKDHMVEWLEPTAPTDEEPERGGAPELNAARQAWRHGDEVAYPASVRYLSELCGCTWTGDAMMLAALGGN